MKVPTRAPTLKDMVQDPWFKSRPKSVQQRIMHYPPGVYRLKTTGQKVVMRSYTETKGGRCNECTVLVLRQYNPEVIMERTVFGIKFEDLEPIETI